ncbi:MAG TPA: hypothetical protein VJH94_04510 [Candidatus Paceibacterota bacterium]
MIGNAVVAPSNTKSYQLNIGNVLYGTDIYNIALANIGISTTTPYAKFSVTGTTITSTTMAVMPVSAQTANILDIYNTSGALTSVVNASSNWGIGTTTPTTKLHVSNGASATTTVTIGELWLTTSKACVNMNQADGSAGSFYIMGGAIVVENNYCR